MLTPARILIVEDEGIIAQDIQRTLKGQGYTVVGVEDTGEGAVALAAELHPDLVLMDIRLSGPMDGIEAARLIRLGQKIPVVYMTAFADEVTLQRAKLTGPFGYVLKPFQSRDIQVAIEIALYRHKMESELRESREWLATTLKSIGEAVLATDTHGSVVFMNELAEALTGWTQTEAIGRNLDEVFRLVYENNSGLDAELISRAIKKGIIAAPLGGVSLISRDNRKICIDYKASPIAGDSQTGQGMVYIFQDIAERLQLGEQLRNFHGMRAVGELAAGVAHEVRNPLNAILAVTEALFQDLNATPEYTPYLETIKVQVERLSKLMRELLELGRPIQQSRMSREALPEICATAIALWQNSPRSPHPAVVLVKPEDTRNCLVTADSSKLQQVFINLLENAVQHSPAGSEIRIVITGPADGRHTVRVIDQGSGLRPENLARVLEPFFTTRKGGTGLGLSIVRHIVQSHNGEITIWNNNPPPGCTVEVRLPAAGGEVL